MSMFSHLLNRHQAKEKDDNDLDSNAVSVANTKSPVHSRLSSTASSSLPCQQRSPSLTKTFSPVSHLNAKPSLSTLTSKRGSSRSNTNSCLLLLTRVRSSVISFCSTFFSGCSRRRNSLLWSVALLLFCRRLFIWAKQNNIANPFSLVTRLSKVTGSPLTLLRRGLPVNNKHHNQQLLPRTSVFDTLFLHGAREHYDAIPAASRRTFHVTGRCSDSLSRAFLYLGWTAVETVATAHVVYRSVSLAHDDYTRTLLPWQRYSRIPYFRQTGRDWEDKDGFARGFNEYQQRTQQNITFLPETYCLSDERDYDALLKVIASPRGYQRPWVLKQVTVNNGHGIEMIGPGRNSTNLQNVLQRARRDPTTSYIVQAYVCHELTWFRQQKFDVRAFWMILSIDPPIVLYHDGYARVATHVYDETNFVDTKHHLTNHEFRAATTDDENVTTAHVWQRVREHYATNQERLATIVPNDDPVQHVRNQMKHAIAATAAAFYNNTFAVPAAVVPQNLFALYGADFILDADLHVWYVEAQSAPGCSSSRDFRIDLMRSLFRPMIQLVEEIHVKQQRNATANLLPLRNLGNWEIVFAGDKMYQYLEYQQLSQEHREATACSTG